jgi:transposase
MKVSDEVIKEIEAGNTNVAAIATKLGVSNTSVTGSLATLKKKGYVLHVVDGELVSEAKPVVVERVEELAGVEYTATHTEIVPVVVEEETVMKTEVVADVEVTTTFKRRGRKMNPDSPRQRAFTMVREMMAEGKLRRSEMRDRLVQELGLKEGNAGIYIQKVREELGLVKHPVKEEEVVVA